MPARRRSSVLRVESLDDRTVPALVGPVAPPGGWPGTVPPGSTVIRAPDGGDVKLPPWVKPGQPIVLANLPLNQPTNPDHNWCGTEVDLPELPAAEQIRITGRVYNDVNGDGGWGPGDRGRPGVRVYLDANDNHRWDFGEPFRRTNAAGQFAFTRLRPGVYHVREEVSPAWVRTWPAARTLTLPSRTWPARAEFGHIRAARLVPVIVPTGPAVAIPALAPPAGTPRPAPFGGPTVAVEPLPAIPSRVEPWPSLQIGPDGTLRLPNPTEPAPPAVVLDWCRVL